MIANPPKPLLFFKKLSELLPSVNDNDDDIDFEFPLKTEEAMLNLEERIKDDMVLQFQMV